MALDRIPIGARLISLSGLALFLLALGAAYGISSMSHLRDATRRQIEESALARTAVDQARTAQVLFKKQVQEWKDILLRGNDAASYAKYHDLFQKEHQGVLDSLEQLGSTARRLHLPTTAIEKALQAHRALFTRYGEALRTFAPADPTTGQKVDRLVVGIDREPTKAIDDIVQNINTQAETLRQQATDATGELYARIRLLYLVGMAGGALLLGLLSIAIIRSITGPLRRSVAYAEAVSRGQLDAALPVSGRDETAALAAAMHTMVENLREKMRLADRKGQEALEEARKAQAALTTAAAETRRAEAGRQALLDAAHRLEEAVGEVAAAGAELSRHVSQANQGADVQAGRLGETATAMEEMNATVLAVAQNATQAAAMADEARNKAQDGATAVDAVAAGVDAVRNQALAMKSDMTDLGERSRSIGRILDVISDIADQTNLLALNAAIEAARAGEAGRGFAVVADEVRKLAEKTMAATKEVGQAIAAIQDGTQKNIANMEHAAAGIEAATHQAQASGVVLASITGFVDKTTDQVRSIATASEQQSATSEEINRSLGDIARIATETSSAMAQAAQTVEKLDRLAATLRELIAHMRQTQATPADGAATPGYPAAVSGRGAAVQLPR